MQSAPEYLTREEYTTARENGWNYNNDDEGLHFMFFNSSEDGVALDIYSIGGKLMLFLSSFFFGGREIEIQPIMRQFVTFMEMIEISQKTSANEGYDIVAELTGCEAGLPKNRIAA